MSLELPLMQDWAGPGGLPDFSDIKASDFEPAFAAAMAEHRAELDAIAAQAEPASFANTAERLDASGRALGRVQLLFYTLNASVSTPALQAVQRDLAAPLAAHASWVARHQGLMPCTRDSIPWGCSQTNNAWSSGSIWMRFGLAQSSAQQIASVTPSSCSAWRRCTPSLPRT
jgi:hypothetical protein